MTDSAARPPSETYFIQGIEMVPKSEYQALLAERDELNKKVLSFRRSMSASAQCQKENELRLEREIHSLKNELEVLRKSNEGQALLVERDEWQQQAATSAKAITLFQQQRDQLLAENAHLRVMTGLDTSAADVMGLALKNMTEERDKLLARIAELEADLKYMEQLYQEELNARR